MKIRSLVALFLALCLIIPVLAVSFAEETETVFYQGGVIERRTAYGAASPLEMGYTLSSSPYIILRSPTMWELVVSGGSAPYRCVAKLYHLADMSLDPFAVGWPQSDKITIEANASFAYTFTKTGRYFWQFEITDASGQKLVFQTRLYEGYTTADETNPATVVGKVNSIIADNITPSMSDYSRALVLHDWLINNANYDYSDDPWYDAEGVLLHETGVCDSYARAYLMLMTAAGVDCMIVSGTANGGNHAWNMVRLGGNWYHVDCTWDDPGSGGYERHDYFCLDDDTMAQDHRWNRPGNIFDADGMLVPAAQGGEYANVSGTTVDYDFTFSTIDEFKSAFNKEITAGNYRATTYGYYIGSEEDEDSVWEDFCDWISNELANDLYGRQLITGCSYGYTSNRFYVTLDWNAPDDYIRIDVSAMRISIGETAVIMPSEYAPVSNASRGPAAFLQWQPSLPPMTPPTV